MFMNALTWPASYYNLVTNALTFQSYDLINNTITIKCPYPSYRVLKFGSVGDMAHNVAKVMTLKDQRVIGKNKRHHRIPWPHKHTSRHQNSYLKCFSSKVKVIDIFLQNGGQHNVFKCVSGPNQSRHLKIYLQAFTQITLCWNLGTFCPLITEIWPKMWLRKRPWPWKVKVIGQNKWHHWVPWPQKHRPRHQNRHPKCFSLKVMVKDIFLYNGGQCNTFVCIARSNRSKYFLIF